MGCVLPCDILLGLTLICICVGGQTRTPGALTVFVRWGDGRDAQGPAYAPPILTGLRRRRNALARDANPTRPLPWAAACGAIAPAGRDGARDGVRRPDTGPGR
jgi:hypothetical protein